MAKKEGVSVRDWHFRSLLKKFAKLSPGEAELLELFWEHGALTLPGAYQLYLGTGKSPIASVATLGKTVAATAAGTEATLAASAMVAAPKSGPPGATLFGMSFMTHFSFREETGRRNGKSNRRLHGGD